MDTHKSHCISNPMLFKSDRGSDDYRNVSLQNRLIGGAPAPRAAVLGTIRRYIEANLHEPDLSPESVLLASQLSRPTLYRLFENKDGLATYIRNRWLIQAAQELRQYPGKVVIEIAYGLGLNSASDFSRAFRRAYDLSPLEFRQFSL